jgi:2-iminoacetate synthase
MSIVDADLMETLVREADRPTDEAVESALQRAAPGSGLSLADASVLLSVTGAAHREMLRREAARVKERVFGRRVVLFAPLYLSNHCANGCLYCGFRNALSGAGRRALAPAEAAREATALVDMGFKRVLLVTGEDKLRGLDYITACVRAVYEGAGMRIVHVNAAPMDAASFRTLKASGVAVYQAFQETYHRPTYEKMHPSGPKRDYDWRLGVMDRAIEGGFQDVGIGALLGLYDYRYDCLATIAHSQHLHERFGAHAHTISVPRLRPAPGSALDKAPFPVSDEDIEKIAAVMRLAVPTAGVVVSTREGPAMRSRLLNAGASQLSATSRTDPGGYARPGADIVGQFSTNDRRPLDEVMGSIARDGWLPSLCTSCYRAGRVGGAFMEKTAAGDMAPLCQANAILTLKEYLSDNRANGSKDALGAALKTSLNEIKDGRMKKAVVEKMKEIEEGGRDVYF